MKILALIGSPKKTGNTIEQVKYFERQAIENQAVKPTIKFESSKALFN